MFRDFLVLAFVFLSLSSNAWASMCYEPDCSVVLVSDKCEADGGKTLQDGSLAVIHCTQKCCPSPPPPGEPLPECVTFTKEPEVEFLRPYLPNDKAIGQLKEVNGVCTAEQIKALKLPQDTKVYRYHGSTDVKPGHGEFPQPSDGDPDSGSGTDVKPGDGKGTDVVDDDGTALAGVGCEIKGKGADMPMSPIVLLLVVFLVVRRR